jgi:hypothetical protein
MAEQAMKTLTKNSTSTSKTTKRGIHLLQCPEGGAGVLAWVLHALQRLGLTQLFDFQRNNQRGKSAWWISSVAKLDDGTSTTNLHSGK